MEIKADEDFLKAHEQAVARGEEEIRRGPLATAVHYDAQSRLITVDLNRGFAVSFSPERAQGLRNATDDELLEIEITSHGLGIYFPRVDEDMRVPAIAKGRFGNDRWEAEWAAAHAVEVAA